MPLRRCCHLRMPLLLFAISVFSAAAHARARSVSTYDGSVDFGAQLLRLDDGCLSVDGTVTSGDFFQNLKRIDVRGRLEYRKRGKVVTDYPETLMASIHILGDKCTALLSSSPSAVFDGNSFSLRFEVNWKDGMELKPATLSPVVAHCVGSSMHVIGDRDFMAPSVTCQMAVDSKDVPLVDHLIVSVFGADGRRLTRLSAGP